MFDNEFYDDEKFFEEDLYDAINIGRDEFDRGIITDIYRTDNVKVSYVPRKDVIECCFKQNDFKIYLTFVTTVGFDLSEDFSNDALEAVTASEISSAEKFDSICKLILGEDYLDELRYGYGNSYGTFSNSTTRHFTIDFYHNRTKVDVCFITDDKNNTLMIEKRDAIVFANMIISSEKALKRIFATDNI